MKRATIPRTIWLRDSTCSNFTLDTITQTRPSEISQYNYVVLLRYSQPRSTERLIMIRVTNISSVWMSHCVMGSLGAVLVFVTWELFLTLCGLKLGLTVFKIWRWSGICCVFLALKIWEARLVIYSVWVWNRAREKDLDSIHYTAPSPLTRISQE